jgi:hypothetical protein
MTHGANTGAAIDGVPYAKNDAFAEFAAFDALPGSIRAILRDTRFELNSEDILLELRNVGPVELAANIHEFDAYMLEQANQERGFS